MTDREIDLFVRAFFDPPPGGFTEEERKQILSWLKSPFPGYLEMPKRQTMGLTVFQYGKIKNKPKSRE